MANERLYQFPAKTTPTPSDIVYLGDAANSNDEVFSTIAQIIGAYPNLSGIGNLTLGANTFPYSNNSSVLTAGAITSLAITLLGDSTITQMQSTLGNQSAPIASRFASWDGSLNLSANSMINGYTTTATAAGTTTLAVTSTWQQFFTGSTTQTVLLPVTSTLALGQSFYIVNNSSGSVTVQSSGGNNIQVMAANTTLLVTCILTSGTTAASWYADYNFQNALTLPLAINQGGTGVTSVTIAPAATAWAGWDANKNLSANNFLEAYATTATAAGTTTLLVGSPATQFFTGVLTQNCVMPVTSTLVLGQQFYIVNNSSGVVTVQSSGGNTIIAMAASTAALLTCILTSGTTAASWYAEYEQASLILPLSMANGGSGASLTGSAGGIVYTSSSTTMAVLAGTATANLFLMSGSNAPPVWGVASGRLINIQVITTTGVGTYTPTTGMATCIGEVQAAGGGSGGSTGAASSSATAGGGGGGAYFMFQATAANIGVSAAISVGAAGSAGASGNNNGGNGGNSSITINGSTWTAGGGTLGGGAAHAGAAQVSGTIGTGGTNTIGSNALLIKNIAGQNATYGWSNGSTGVLGVPSNGGDSELGMGGVCAGGAGAAVVGSGYGAGAGGAYNGSASNVAGAVGSQGIIIIYEFS